MIASVGDSVVYQKTAKGQNEVETRAYRLPARARAVLILVDGKTSAKKIVQALRHLPQAQGYLSDLIKEGFIAPLATAAPAGEGSRSRHTAPTPPPAGPPPVSLSSAKQFASHFLLDQLGPDAEAIALRIEACENMEQARPALEKAREVLRGVRGPSTAELFWQGVSERSPKA